MMKTILYIIALIAAGAIYFMYTQPAYSNVKTLKAEIVQYNQALDKAAELKQLKDALLGRLNTFDPEAKDRLLKMLPNHVDNVRLILDLDRLAAAYEIPLENVTISGGSETESSSKTSGGQTSVAGPKAIGAGGAQSALGSITASKQKYDSLTMTFSTRTSYEKFIAFLEALQSSLRMIDIISLTVAPESGSKSGERQYQYGITIKTYWLR